jgi:Lon protease-like protein
MSADRYSDERLEAAIESLLEPGRFSAAEERVARAAPQLQRVLASSLAEGGYFDPSHEEQLAKAAATADAEERLTAFRTLLAEEARLGMMVGVAVGWELARELDADA